MNDDLRRAVDHMRGVHGVDGARRLLRALDVPSAARYLESTERQRVCRAMLDAREPRPGIRDRLVRMGMSRRSAYELIDSTLCERGRESAQTRATIGAMNHSKGNP